MARSHAIWVAFKPASGYLPQHDLAMPHAPDAGWASCPPNCPYLLAFLSHGPDAAFTVKRELGIWLAAQISADWPVVIRLPDNPDGYYGKGSSKGPQGPIRLTRSEISKICSNAQKLR